MDRIEWTEVLCFAGLRLLGFAMLLFGGLQLLFALLDVWYRFDPSYFGAFFSAHLLRPLAVLAAGAVVYLFSPPLACRMARKIRNSGS